MGITCYNPPIAHRGNTCRYKLQRRTPHDHPHALGPIETADWILRTSRLYGFDDRDEHCLLYPRFQSLCPRPHVGNQLPDPIPSREGPSRISC